MNSRFLTLLSLLLVAVVFVGGLTLALRERQQALEQVAAAELAKTRADEARALRGEGAALEPAPSPAAPAEAVPEEPVPDTAQATGRAAVDTLEAKVSRTLALVDELLEVAFSDDEDAQVAAAGLQQVMSRVMSRGQEVEAQRRREMNEAWRRGEASRANARVWIEDVTQFTDPARRAAALDQLRQALSSDDPQAVSAALQALQGLAEVEYDKAGFRDQVLAIAQGAEGELLTRALYALAATERRPEDLALALRAAADDEVDAGAATRLLFLFNDGDLTGEVGDALIRRLGSDPDARQAVHSMWGARVSPGIEARILALADSLDHSTRHDAVYYGLSTWRDKSPAVVAKLLALLEDGGEANRALWGLGHGVPEESHATVAATMQAYFEAKSDLRSKRESLRLIGMYGSAVDLPWLEALRDHPNTPSDLRERAAAAVAAVAQR